MPRINVDVGDLASRTVAVDAANVIYRHLFQIRDSHGRPYRNAKGQMIGHLIGLLNETSILRGLGIHAIFVFDGETPKLKEETVDRRAAQAADRGFKVDIGMKDEMKRTLDALGVPWVQAPEEAEAQASFMTLKGCWAVLTNDYDALLFGASRMIRSISRENAEMCVLAEVLKALELERRELVDIGILMGTDYNPGGIRGVGPRRSLEMIRRHGSLVAILAEFGASEDLRRRLTEVEAYYLNPPITSSWEVKARRPDVQEAREFLVNEMMLDPRIVERVIGHLSPSRTRSSQARLSGWK